MLFLNIVTIVQTLLLKKLKYLYKTDCMHFINKSKALVEYNNPFSSSPQIWRGFCIRDGLGSD